MHLIDGTESLSHAISRLHASGYEHDFLAEASGLRDLTTGALFAPEVLLVDEVIRFEGVTDPDDEAIVCALSHRTEGVRGTYSAAYGAGMDSLDADMMQRLPASRT